MSARSGVARGRAVVTWIALGLALGGCARNTSADGGTADPARAGGAATVDGVPSDLLLTLERGPCFGTCPVYSLEIDAAGGVRYRGEGFVRVTGDASDTIPRERVAALAAAFENSDFFALADRYAYGEPTCPEYHTDMPSVTLTARVDGRTKRVHADYGCSGIPRAVTELARAMDEAAGTERWTGTEEG